MSRKPFVAGNWKMHKTAGEGAILTQKIEPRAEDFHEKIDIAVAPPFTALNAVANAIRLDHAPIALAAQDMFWMDKGAFTGAIAPRMLEDFDVSYVILGHSERREYFHEDNEIINRKVKACFEHGMKAILCVGESLTVREEGKTIPFIRKQIEEGLAGLDRAHVDHLTVAYEPIWAIGSGQNATPAMAQEVAASIRHTIEELYDAEAARRMRILYGGSVKAANASFYFAQEDVDGALVGGAALEADSFNGILQEAYNSVVNG